MQADSSGVAFGNDELLPLLLELLDLLVDLLTDLLELPDLLDDLLIDLLELLDFDAELLLYRKEGPHLAMTGRLVGFLKVQCLVGVSHEIGRGAQGDSCGATEVRSPWTWRGGAPHCSQVMVGVQYCFL